MTIYYCHPSCTRGHFDHEVIDWNSHVNSLFTLNIYNQVFEAFIYNQVYLGWWNLQWTSDIVDVSVFF